MGRVQWRLGELLSKRPDLTYQAIADALEKDGAHPISRTQVGRLATTPPQNTAIALIGALCRILRCTPNDLLGWESVPYREPRPGLAAIREQGRQAAASGRVAKAAALSADSPRLDETERARVVGPRVRAMPTHPLARTGGKG